VKKDEMGKVYGMHGGKETALGLGCGKLNE
jgi:hypothetical protein